MLRIAAVTLAALHLAVPGLVAGQARSEPGDGPRKGPLVKDAGTGGRQAAPSHMVSEGDAMRPLWVDSTRVADFGRPDSGRPVLRPPHPGVPGDKPRIGKQDAGTGAPDPGAGSVSPVFLDASGQPMALAGGVIVTFSQELPEQQGREQLEAAGLTPVRQIGARMWMVESPVGIESLELAEHLHAQGIYESVQANWWQPRATK